MNLNDLQARQILRQARGPAQGSRITAGVGGNLAARPVASATVVSDDGKALRLWIDGDDWDDGHYFGTGDLETVRNTLR